MACSAPWSRAVPVTERSGVDLSAPRRAEAAGDLTEDDGGADFSLAGVVGGRHVGVFEEDEELGSPCLDGGLQLATALGSNVILPQRRWR